MIPISALLTPYEAPPQAPPGMVGRSIGGLADSIEERRRFDTQEADRKAQQDRQNELQQGQLGETTRYHDLLYKEHGEAMAEKQNAAKDKIREHLFDRLHKANTPDEKVAVINEFRRLGDVVEESASAYQPKPTENTPPEAPKVEAEAKAAGQAKPKARIEPPEFAGYDALSPKGPRGTTSYATEGENPEPRYLASDPAKISRQPVPPEIAALVPEGATAAKPSAPEPPQNKGGKFTIRDSEGNIIHEYDAPMEKQKVLTSITEMGKPFVKNAGFPEDEKAAQAAADFAATQVGLVPADKIPELYLKAYAENLSGYKKKHIAGQEGTGPGTDDKHLVKIEDETQKVINSAVTRNKVAAINEWDRHTQMAAGLLNQPHGFAQTSALVAWAKGLNGRAPPAQEMDALKNSEGVLNGFLSKLNRWDPKKDGELSPGFIAGMRSAFDQATIDVARAKQQVADEASGQIDQSFIPYRGGEREQAKKRAAAAFVKPSAKPAPAATGGETIEQKRARIAAGL